MIPGRRAMPAHWLWRLRPAFALALVALPVGTAWAQRGPANAQLSSLVEVAQARPGSEVRAALTVRLPEGYHTNSNRPRDPSLIPITLTFGTLPAGVTVKEIVFPESTDLVQRGADQPLRVFDGDFAIGVVLAVASGTPAAKVEIPATLRYQACDEVACYLPVRAPVSWAFAIAGRTGPRQHGDVFAKIKFGTGEPPGDAGALASTPAVAVVSPAPDGGGSPGSAAVGLGAFAQMGGIL